MPWNRTTRKDYTRDGGRYESDVTDEEWAIIEPMIPKQGRLGRPRKTDPREVFNAIQYVLATGCQWRVLPRDFPPHSTVMKDFYRWQGSGVFDRMMDALRELARTEVGRRVEPTAAIIDSQSVKTTESGGLRGYDGGKKVVGRKRHLAVDVEGSPIVVDVHAASVQDRDGAPAVIMALLDVAVCVEKLFADSAYAGPKLQDALKELGVSELIEIVPKPKGVKGFTVLSRRWVVERTFAWMGRCRRLAKDVERTLASSLAWVKLAGCRFRVSAYEYCHASGSSSSSSYPLTFRRGKGSTKPPSSDSPFQRPVSKQDKPPGKRGARMGHPGSGSRLLRPTERRAIHPGPCACGQGVPGQTAPYHLHQVMELPPMALHVTHWVLHQGRCSGCGRLLKARLPKAQQTGYGPRLTALIGELSAMHRISRRGVQDFCRSVLGAPISLGAIQRLIDRASLAIVPHDAAIARLARKARVGYVDETPWYCRHALQWLWSMVTDTVALYRIHSKRSQEAFGSLIKDWRGILVSDGYGVYQAWGNARQTCLAHLIRRARELSQRQVPGLAACGKAVLQELQRLCQMAHAPPSGGQWQAWYARLCRLMKRYGLRPLVDAIEAFMHDRPPDLSWLYDNPSHCTAL